MKTSIVIPSRNEVFLLQTVEDLITKAAGEIEVIVVLDGYWPNPPLPNYPNLIIIHHSESRGMRSAINSGASIAKGEYLMKCDAHCLFAEGYDEVLKSNYAEDNWVMTLSRYSLDYEKWAIANNRPRIDYHYLSCPYANPNDFTMHGQRWNERARERSDPQYDIDDEMSSQGSCWFMSKKHFDNFLGGLSEEGYGTFTQEFQEIGMKTWLGGGAVKINKKTWYAHLHKGKAIGRGYHLDRADTDKRNEWSARYWTENRWEKRVHDFDWLIDKFSPVPTWIEDWKNVYRAG